MLVVPELETYCGRRDRGYPSTLFIILFCAVFCVRWRSQNCFASVEKASSRVGRSPSVFTGSFDLYIHLENRCHVAKSPCHAVRTVFHTTHSSNGFVWFYQLIVHRLHWSGPTRTLYAFDAKIIIFEASKPLSAKLIGRRWYSTKARWDSAALFLRSN